jgi:hypothetical protein
MANNLPSSILFPSDAPIGTQTSAFIFDTRTSIPTVMSTGSTAPATTTPATTTATEVPATSSPTASSAPSNGGGLSLPQELAAIIAPIAFIIVLAPILYLLWVHRKTKKMQQEQRDIPDSSTPAPETRLLRHSPQNSMFLPSPFTEADRTKEGSLGVYELRRSLEDKARSDSIGIFNQPTPSGNNSPLQPPHRGPSPTLPSPKVPAFNRPPSEAWPLPANSKLPSPQTLYDPYLNSNKPLPLPIGNTAAPPNMPLPPPPTVTGRANNSDVLSYASSDVLTAPASHFRPTSSNYDLTPSTANFPENVRTQGSKNETSGMGRSRDSDLVSELSFRSPSTDRRRDVDAVSVVSAMTDRRRSERDPDAVSIVSALSPEEPSIPMEHYPLR